MFRKGGVTMNHTQEKEHTEDTLQWHDWGREAFAQAAAEGKPMRIVCDGPLNGQTVNLMAIPGSGRSRKILVTLPGLLSAAITLTPTYLQPC